MTPENEKTEEEKCREKVSYRTFSEANYVRKTYGKNDKMQIYRCPFCGNWHLKKRKKK